jgi:hypothetical protein
VPALFRSYIQQAPNHYLQTTIYAVKSGLIFLLRSYAEKTPTLEQNILPPKIKNSAKPLCSRNRGRQLSASQPFLSPPCAPTRGRLATFMSKSFIKKKLITSDLAQMKRLKAEFPVLLFKDYVSVFNGSPIPN